MLNNDEYTEIEGRLYPNPQVSLDESLSFIDNLRTSQGQQNQEIVEQTRNLGTDIPSNLGGLTGGESYWTSRYQIPQSNAVAANLRATAQAAALNQVLQNEQAKWKKRYNDAYKAYQKRANNRANGGGSGSGGTDLADLLKKLGYDVNPDEELNGNVSENTNVGPGLLDKVAGGLQAYIDASGNRWTLRNPEVGDEVLLGGLTSVGGNLKNTFPDGTPLTSGAVYNAGGGRVFMYVDNPQTGTGKIYRVADSPTMSYR